jgi:hypothetical protein
VSKTRQAMIDHILSLHPPAEHAVRAVRHTYEQFDDSKLNSLLEQLQKAVSLGSKISSETTLGQEPVRGEIAEIRNRRRGLIERLEQVEVLDEKMREALESKAQKQPSASSRPDRIADWEALAEAILKKAARSVSKNSFVIHTSTGVGQIFAVAELLNHVNQFTRPAKIFNDQVAALIFPDDFAIDKVARTFSINLCDTISSHIRGASKTSMSDLLQHLQHTGGSIFEAEVKNIAAHAFISLTSSNFLSQRKELAIRLVLARELAASSRYFPFISPELKAEVLPHRRSINSPSEIIKSFSKLAIAAQATQAVVIGYHDGISRALAEFLAQSAGCARSSVINFKNKGDWKRAAQMVEAAGQDKPVILAASYFSEGEEDVERLLTDTAAAVQNAQVRVLSLATREEPKSLRDVHYTALLTEAKIDGLWARDARCSTSDEAFSFAGASGHATLSISAEDLARETRTKLEIEADYQKQLAALA